MSLPASLRDYEFRVGPEGCVGARLEFDWPSEHIVAHVRSIGDDVFGAGCWRLAPSVTCRGKPLHYPFLFTLLPT